MSNRAKDITSRLTHDELIESLDYDKETGIFRWKVTRGSAKAGMVCQSRDGSGYIQISLWGTHYKAHRLAIFYVHGRWPYEEVDHINGITSDNRFENLRECSVFENQANRSVSINKKTSKIKGVYWNSGARCWVAAIYNNHRRSHLGCFKTEEDAANAYKQAADLLQREFAYHASRSEP